MKVLAFVVLAVFAILAWPAATAVCIVASPWAAFKATFEAVTGAWDELWR